MYNFLWKKRICHAIIFMIKKKFFFSFFYPKQTMFRAILIPKMFSWILGCSKKNFFCAKFLPKISAPHQSPRRASSGYACDSSSSAVTLLSAQGACCWNKIFCFLKILACCWNNFCFLKILAYCWNKIFWKFLPAAETKKKFFLFENILTEGGLWIFSNCDFCKNFTIHFFLLHHRLWRLPQCPHGKCARRRAQCAREQPTTAWRFPTKILNRNV